MRRRRGMALIIALLVVAAAALFALTAASRSRDVAMDGARDRACAAARAAAEGGIERARWALARDPDARYEGETLRVGNSDVTVRVTRQADARIDVVSVATAPSAPFADTVSRRVEATLVASGGALPAITAWRE